MAKVVILAAGDGERWGDYLGVPKQLISINGESLLERMVRLVRRNGIHDIDVVAIDERLRIPGCGFYRPERRRWTVESMLSSRGLWKEDTIVLLGDVYFTDRAIRRVARYDGPLRVFGRYEGSILTGHPYGEVFALRFRDGQGVRIAQHLQSVVDSGGGGLWRLYRSMMGFPLDANRIENHVFRSVDDFTDDFDDPCDYDKAIRRYGYITSPKPIVRHLSQWYFYSYQTLYKMARAPYRWVRYRLFHGETRRSHS